MKYAQLAMSVVLTLICELRGMELNVDERLSRYFSEITLTNCSSVLLRTQNVDPNILSVRIGERGEFVSVTNGSVHVVAKNQAFYFRYSRCPVERLCLEDSDVVAKKFPQAPLEFLRDTGGVLVFEEDSTVTLISIERNVACALGDGKVVKFRFPFSSIWANEREFGLWWAGEPFRKRIDDVRERVSAARKSAESVLDMMKKRFAAEIESTAFDGDSTSSEFPVSLENWELSPKFGKAVLRVKQTKNGRVLSKLSLMTLPHNEQVHQYLFDRDGHLRWFFARDDSKRNQDGLFAGPEGLTLFELTQSGDVRRAYCGNVHPLQIVTDRTFFFTGDGKLIREFFADWRANRE